MKLTHATARSVVFCGLYPLMEKEKITNVLGFRLLFALIKWTTCAKCPRGRKLRPTSVYPSTNYKKSPGKALTAPWAPTKTFSFIQCPSPAIGLLKTANEVNKAGDIVHLCARPA